MKRILAVSCFLVLVFSLLTCSAAIAGDWSANNFIYKPSLGARGEAEKDRYNSSLDRVDARLGKEVWVGDPNYGPTLQDAVTAIGSTQATLRIPAGIQTIAADVAIPANINVKPERGATLAVATGKTLTINGPFEAGAYQVFDCTGTGKVVFGARAVKQIRPEWWGNNTTPGTTDMAPALQAAITAAQTANVPVELTGGGNSNCYLINSGLSKTSGFTGLRIIGTGQGASVIKAGGAFVMLDLDGGGWYLEIHNLRLDGNNVATGGLRIGHAASGPASNSGWGKLDLKVVNVAGHGVEANWCEYMDVGKLDIEYCTGSGLKLTSCQQWTFANAWLGDNLVDLDFNAANVMAGNFVLENHAGTTTNYHALIRNSHTGRYNFYLESNVAPVNCQVKLYDNCYNNTITGGCASVNTNKDFIVIGDAADTNLCNQNVIKDFRVISAAQAGHYHVNIVKGQYNKIEDCRCTYGYFQVTQSSDSAYNIFRFGKYDRKLAQYNADTTLGLIDTYPDRVVEVIDDTANVVINLPSAAQFKGQQFYIRKLKNTSYQITVQRSGTDYIWLADASATANMQLGKGNDFLHLISDGTYWKVVDGFVSFDYAYSGPDIAANSTSDVAFSMAGIRAGDLAYISALPAGLPGGLMPVVKSAAPGVVNVRFANVKAAALSPNGTYTIAVKR